MQKHIHRRHFLQGTLACSIVPVLPAWGANSITRELELLEHSSNRTIGLWALDTGNGRSLAYRAEERFPFCSTFKIILAGAILHQSETESSLLERRIHYVADQLVDYSPITQKYVATGMTVAELCAAAIQYSDNTAANLLLALVGGPVGLTNFARTNGDPVFRLDRTEPGLNSALPGDPRDTSTPLAMGTLVQRLVLTDHLTSASRKTLQNWLKGNTTGASRIRAGVPQHWVVGDKTGSGDYGVANDIATIWPEGRAPWVLGVFTRGMEKAAPLNSDIIAAATRLVVSTLKN